MLSCEWRDPCRFVTWRVHSVVCCSIHTNELWSIDQRVMSNMRIYLIHTTQTHTLTHTHTHTHTHKHTHKHKIHTHTQTHIHTHTHTHTYTSTHTYLTSTNISRMDVAGTCTELFHMRDMTHSCVWRDSFKLHMWQVHQPRLHWRTASDASRIIKFAKKKSPFQIHDMIRVCV